MGGNRAVTVDAATGLKRISILEDGINDVSNSVGRFQVSLKNSGLCSFGIGEGHNWG